MRYFLTFNGGFSSILLLLLLLLLASSVDAERPPLEPRVPTSKMEQAKNMKAPYGDAWNASPAIISEGKILYEGKGNCTICHGVSGEGDGPAARMQRPHPPRDFSDCTVQKARKDGELFWTIAHGSTGTSMPRFVPGMLTEEEAWKLVAYVRSFCKS